jgi:hypothetical protein
VGIVRDIAGWHRGNVPVNGCRPWRYPLSSDVLVKWKVVIGRSGNAVQLTACCNSNHSNLLRVTSRDCRPLTASRSLTNELISPSRSNKSDRSGTRDSIILEAACKIFFFVVVHRCLSRHLSRAHLLCPSAHLGAAGILRERGTRFGILAVLLSKRKRRII